MNNRSFPLEHGFALRSRTAASARAWLAALLTICAGVFGVAPVSAASLNGPISGWTQGDEPPWVSMYEYVPDNLAPNPPILVVVHFCSGNAVGVFRQAQDGGMVAAADQHGFILVVPQTTRNCWDVATPASLTHDGGGDTRAIVHQVQYAIAQYGANADRVYLTGTSSGAMVTQAMLATYPDVFKAGAAFAGVPAGCWSVNNPEGQWSSPCAGGEVTHTPQEWGDMVREMYPGYDGFRPRIQLWHGEADSILSLVNHNEALEQWTNVLGLPPAPNLTTSETIDGGQYVREQWLDECGTTVLDSWVQSGGPHGTDANMNGEFTIPFFALNQAGAVDPQVAAGCTSPAPGAAGQGANDAPVVLRPVGGGSAAAEPSRPTMACGVAPSPRGGVAPWLLACFGGVALALGRRRRARATASAGAFALTLAAFSLTSPPAAAQTLSGEFGAEGSTGDPDSASADAEGDATTDAAASSDTETTSDGETTSEPETSEPEASEPEAESPNSEDAAPSGEADAPSGGAKLSASVANPAEAEPAAQSTTPAQALGFPPAFKSPRIETPTMSLQLGLIAQPQFEAVGAPDAAKTTKNLFVRRAGLFVSGTVFDSFEFFFDVDYPNLFKVDPTNQTGGTGKNSPGLNVQDIMVTYKPLGKLLKVDAGFMLPPLSHNALQGAGTLYGWDYFVNSFRRNVLSSLDPFSSIGQSPQGRDAGFQVRGLLLNEHVEYRAGLFQGLRVGPLPAAQGTEAEVGGVNFFRVSARVQVNVLDAEPDFFYQGTYLGTKKVLSFGTFYDFQDQYTSLGGDMILDLPLGPGILTAQANVVHWDGGTFIQTLPKHTAVMAEAGYLLRSLMLSPIVRFERLIAASPTPAAPGEDRIGGGLAFWPFGHTSNLKLFYTRVHRLPAPEDFNQFNLQWQMFFF